MKVRDVAHTHVITVAPNDSIDRAISLMEEFDIHHLVVVHDGRVAGMLSDRDILISTGWMLSAERRIGEPDSPRVIGPARVEQIMSRPAVSVEIDDALPDAVRILDRRRISALPVVERGRLWGILTETDLIRWLLHADARPDGPVRRYLDRSLSERCTRRVITAGPDEPIMDVVDRFRRHRIRHVPVLDGGRLVGLVADRDIRRLLGWEEVHEALADEAGRVFEPPQRVAEVMQTRLHTQPPEAPLREAVRTMLEHRVHSVLVARGDALFGILTETDLVRDLLRCELI